VNIHAAKIKMAHLLDTATAGEDVIIARAGEPVARLVPMDAPTAKRRLGLLAGKLRVSANFDDPRRRMTFWLISMDGEAVAAR
jgi:prevent-host-death family protein